MEGRSFRQRQSVLVAPEESQQNWGRGELEAEPPSVAEPQRHCANFPGQPFYGEKPHCCISCCGRHQPKAILQVGRGCVCSHREARKQPGDWGRGMYGGVKCHPLPFICALLKVEGGQQNQRKSPLPCAWPLHVHRGQSHRWALALPFRQPQWTFTSSAAAASPWGTAAKGREP